MSRSHKSPASPAHEVHEPVHEIVDPKFFAANCGKCPYLEGSEPVLDQIIRGYCKVANAIDGGQHPTRGSATPKTVKSALKNTGVVLTPINETRVAVQCGLKNALCRGEIPTKNEAFSRIGEAFNFDRTPHCNPLQSVSRANEAIVAEILDCIRVEEAKKPAATPR